MYDLGYGLAEATQGHTLPSYFDVMTRLFDGHPVPAIFAYSGYPRGWQPVPETSRRTAFAAHVLGLALVGSYPFRGVGYCSCPTREHTCDGLGANYVCIDIDAHKGESDMLALAGRVLSVMVTVGLRPVTFTSQSGTGVHVFAFFDRPVNAALAHGVGRAVVEAAGAGGRCDVIPSPGHRRGYGTLHALPLSPRSAERGGGFLLDRSLRPVLDQDAIGGLLAEADAVRSSRLREVVEALPVPVRAAEPQSSAAPEPAPEGDAAIYAAMLRGHPQFRRAIETTPSAWKGGRSARDAALAAQMARQGMSPAGIKAALLSLPGTKSGARGEGYAEALSQAPRSPSPEPALRLAGQKARRQDGAPRSPWRDRIPPPLDYDGEPNPWWAVRDRLKAPRRRAGRTDAVVLAYLIDRWYRGPFRRRQYYLSMRKLASALDIPVRTVTSAVQRIGAEFGDVLQVTKGRRGVKLRIATAFHVVCAAHTAEPSAGDLSGQTHVGRLYLGSDGSKDSGRPGLGVQHARNPEVGATPADATADAGVPHAVPTRQRSGRSLLLRG